MPPALFAIFAMPLLVLAVPSATVQAADAPYPVRPMRIVTGFPAGGNTDIIARSMAQKLTERMGQQVIVENRPGAGSMLGTEYVARATPDGYTLLLVSGAMTTQAAVMKKLPFDAARDFAYISNAVTYPFVVVVKPDAPMQNVTDLIAVAKKSPGKLTYASVGIGSVFHLGTELFNAMAGVDMVRINYKGASQSLADLLGGQIQVMFPTPNSASSHVKSGRLKALAVGSAQPSALFPGLPSVAASGLPGYESVALYGMLAPAKTPMPLISRLSQDISRFVNRTELKEKLFSMGVEAVGSSPDEFAAAMRADIARMGKVIRDAGIKAD